MSSYDPDTIRVLVSTDNHVGYAEHDPFRSDDSWQTFDEVLSLAKTHDVDMVLLGGDLFHENNPSKKSMSKVVNSFHEHCLGDKPVSLEMIGDQTEHFPSHANHVNFLDPNMNVSIPVFSIHGNHDDPTGPENKSALDLLHDNRLLNYYGRVSKVDEIAVKPLLMQKGSTKLALYGLSNIRDERLFQTFREHKVTFYSPSQARDEWFNILSVHQNHTPHTDSSYLPESSLPSNMDLVIWGHEHECKIHPRENLDMGFKVMQPGSTVATSLIPGEAVPKQVAILNITGKACKVDYIRLKTVRPFVYRDIILRNHKEMEAIARKPDNLIHVKKFCQAIIEDMIQQAKAEWLRHNPEYDDTIDEIPRPLIRLRVEYTAPEGCEFQVEQNQRFSQQYRDVVANGNDVIQFHKRRTMGKRINAKADLPDAEDLSIVDAETIKVEALVRKHLNFQSLTMLPHNLFSDAVIQFVEKGDKQALDHFIDDNVALQIENLFVAGEDPDDDEDEQRVLDRMAATKALQEDRFDKGQIRARQSELRPKPDGWDSDENGPWIDDPASRPEQDENDDGIEDNISVASDAARANGRGRGARARGRGGRTTAAVSTTRKTAAAKKAPAKKTTRGRKAPIEDDDDDEEMLDVDEDDDSGGLFVSQEHPPVSRRTATRSNGVNSATTSRRAPASSLRQTALSFTGASATQRPASKPVPRRQEPVDDEIESDDDAFEPIAPTRSTRR